MEIESVGICCGSSTVAGVSLDGRFVESKLRHNGDVADTAQEILNILSPSPNAKIVITGRARQAFSNYPYVTEPEALQRALKEFVSEEYPEAVVSFGGQTILAYEVDTQGYIVRSHSFNKCGSGTGEFMIQQIGRLGFTSLTHAMDAANDPLSYANPYVPASRCSVFCKSDCTHAANEGKASTSQITAGLCLMVAQKIAELAGKIEARCLWLIGGGSALGPVRSYLEDLGFRVTIPPHAEHFEAWGAALLGADDDERACQKQFMASEKSDSFPRLPPLENFSHLVTYKEALRGEAEANDQCILSIDVGSTTTKAALLRLDDLSLLASHYGYTHGMPHKAMLECFAELDKLITVPIQIVGINVTGSGRYLAEAFLTDYALQDKNAAQISVVNEITCHATAAERLNPGVSCVLEIGGQDAKYTYLESGVPLDFCMNEACSAGTGSFLAEVAKELFQIQDPNKIAPTALEGKRPIKFGEQCSAFIESDINSALREGALQEDVMAGLCYSVCYNYVNRVVGNRPIRGTISLQGGTAYNPAFCLAMAGVLSQSAILGKDDRIIVSREAGLMGVIGGAAFLVEKIRQGGYKLIHTTLATLLTKELKEASSFECRGCTYKCSIKRFEITSEGKSTKVPFGGFCRKYDTIRRGSKPFSSDDYDFTALRDQMLFGVYSNLGQSLSSTAPSIGVLGNFFELKYLPLFSTIFASLGMRTVLADAVDQNGLQRQSGSYCWPVGRSHGLMENLIQKNPDFFWMPHVHTVESSDITRDQCCPLAQGTPFLLKTAFPEIPPHKIMDPYLCITDDISDLLTAFTPLAKQIGVGRRKLKKAIEAGIEAQRCFTLACKQKGRELLEELAQCPGEIAFVMVGRPYNALSNHLGSNKGLSRKIASMGIRVIPLDFLPLDEVEDEPDMYWSAGQDILRAARFIAQRKELYGVFLTNFSCGPDSFLVTKYRRYLDGKPSLILEFDAHTANAGFDTRIEAFHEIVQSFIRVSASGHRPEKILAFDGSTLETDPEDIRDQKMRVVIPDMGSFYSQALSATLESFGVRTTLLPQPDHTTLALGRRHASCKECLPYNLTIGSFLHYLEHERESGESTALFMPAGSGPCRFGQYSIHTRLLLHELGYSDVTVLSPSDSTAYAGLGPSFRERAWIALVAGSLVENISCALQTLAVDVEEAKTILHTSWGRIVEKIRGGVQMKNISSFLSLLQKEAQILKTIPLHNSLDKVPKVLITGEIYVRLSDFTTLPIVRYLGQHGIVAVKEPATNWLKYVDYIYQHAYVLQKQSMKARFLHFVKRKVQVLYERLITDALSMSGLCADTSGNIEEIIKWAQPYLSDRLWGEAILTIGSARFESLGRYAGVVVVGPFGCMPTRLASGILTYTMSVEDKVASDPHCIPEALRKSCSHCPFITLETDGVALSPITCSSLDAFCVVAKRVHGVMQKS